MELDINEIINTERWAIDSEDYRLSCNQTLTEDGVLVVPDFLTAGVIRSIQTDGENNQSLAYYTGKKHNIYLDKPNADYPDEHPRNFLVTSSKGCLTTDQIPLSSALHTLYASTTFQDFLCAVLGEEQLYEYADPLSSINLHYANEGQELGWHFDNSSFAITLLIQKPEGGGVFEYVKDVRNADAGDMNFELSEKVLSGEVEANSLDMEAGTLVLFRGRNSMHRVTPVVGEKNRMLVVLAYNTLPGVSLSESARMTFYGRLG